MKMVFDASTLISVSQTCLVKILGGLKRKMGADFIVPESVFYEAVQRPIEIRRFELNAIRIKKVIEENGFSVMQARDKSVVEAIESSANSCFLVKGRPIRLLQRGEIEALAIARETGAEALAIDERTTRMLIENPEQLRRIIQERRNIGIGIDGKKQKAFSSMFSGLTIVRSVELIALADEYGLLEEELPRGKQSLEAALFAAKYSGCAVSGKEITMFLHGLGEGR
jgi:predicted nucleic acid-binding protein